MKTYTSFKSVLLTSLIATSLIFAGCGGGGGGGNAAPTPSNPSGQSSVNAPTALQPGTVLTVQAGPVFTLSDPTNFAYSNTGANAFTSGITAGGWYYYASGNTGYLVLSGNGAADSKILSGANFRVQGTLSNFVGTASAITGASLSIGGQSFNVTFSGTANAPAASTPPTGQGSSVIPSSIVGTYQWVAGLNQAGSPYSDGTRVTVSIGQGGSLALNGTPVNASPVLAPGITTTEPIVYYNWNAGAMTYTAQVSNNSTLNSLSVLNNGTFVGQIADSTTFPASPGNASAPLVGKIHHVVLSQDNWPDDGGVVGSTGRITVDTYTPGTGTANFGASVEFDRFGVFSIPSDRASSTSGNTTTLTSTSHSITGTGGTTTTTIIINNTTNSITSWTEVLSLGGATYTRVFTTLYTN